MSTSAFSQNLARPSTNTPSKHLIVESLLFPINAVGKSGSPDDPNSKNETMMQSEVAQHVETLRLFAHDVRASLQQYWVPGTVLFRGSFAEGSFDEYSDVDLEAQVHRALDDGFYSGLERFLKDRYGPALVRYDPDFRENTTSQNVRFSFDRLPVFWRLDLTITSVVDTRTKAPSPFPGWDEGTSALMNVIWAIKNHKRGINETASHYLACACDKIALNRLMYSNENVHIVLALVQRRSDTDQPFLARVAATLD